MTRKESEDLMSAILPQPRRRGVAVLTLDTLGDGQENAGDEGLAVVRLLEDDDLLSKTGAVR